MARPNFLDDNEHRTYPFDAVRPIVMLRPSAGSITLPTEALVDFRCVVGLDAEWNDDIDRVYLTRITHFLPTGSLLSDPGSLRFEFESSAIGLSDLVLTFEIRLDTFEFTGIHAEAVQQLDGLPPPGNCGDTLRWSGTLTIGNLAPLAALLPMNAYVTASAGAIPVERALVQDIGQTYVRSLNIANRPRTMATAPTGCSPTTVDTNLVIVERCIQGDVAIKAGYSLDLRQNARTNTLTFSARVGAGAGEPCVEVPRYVGETPPSGSTLLTGGPSCAELMSSVNGASASVLRLIAGQGVTITPSEDDDHTIVIAFELRDLLTCMAFFDSSH